MSFSGPLLKSSRIRNAQRGGGGGAPPLCIFLCIFMHRALVRSSAFLAHALSGFRICLAHALCIYMRRAPVRSSAFFAHALLGFWACLAHALLGFRARVWKAMVLADSCMKIDGVSRQLHENQWFCMKINGLCRQLRENRWLSWQIDYFCVKLEEEVRLAECLGSPRKLAECPAGPRSLWAIYASI